MHSLGIFSYFGYQLPIEQRLALIKQAGFDTTCLWLGDEEEEVRAGRQDSLPPLIQSHGLALDNVHVPYKNCNKLWSTSSSDVQETVTGYRTHIIFCRNHAIPTMVMHITEGEDPPPLSSQGLSAIRGLVRFAEGSRVVIALENTRRFDYLEMVFSNIQSPNLRFCYDSSHDFMSGKSKGGILERWGHLVVTTHLSDSNQGTTDDHLFPGTGTIDWSSVGKQLYKSGYTGTLMLEVDNAVQSNLPAEQFLRKCYGWLAGFRHSLTK